MFGTPWFIVPLTGSPLIMSLSLPPPAHFPASQCDVFSLGITLYEIISGRPLPPNGEEWHSLRSGKVGMPMGLPADLSKTLQEMMHVSIDCYVAIALSTHDRSTKQSLHPIPVQALHALSQATSANANGCA